MSNHDVERALVQGLADLADDRLNETIRSMETDLDRLRDSWATTYAEQRRAAEQRIAEIRAETQQYLRAISTGEATEPAPADVRQIPQDAPSPGEPVPPGAGSAGPPTDPYAAELAEAERIRTMPMQDWAEVRKTLIRTSDGLFG